MSLDVELVGGNSRVEVEKIYIREDGETVAITPEEWAERYPDRAPVVAPATETKVLYWANITHNLSKMANQAGLYTALWRPEEAGFETAKDITGILEEGLTRLKRDPDFFRVYNPPNGWGNYDGLVRFVENYLEACRKYPDAKIRAYR